MNQVTFALQNIKIRLWYFTYVFSRLIEGENGYEKLLPVLLHGKFKQTKVKTKIIKGSPPPVYKGLEAIECLRKNRTHTKCKSICLSLDHLTITLLLSLILTVITKKNKIGSQLL